MILGMLDFKVGLYFTIIGFFSGLLSQYGIHYLLQKYHSTAILIYILGSCIGLSCISMGFLGIYNIRNEGFQGFRSIC